MCLRIPAGPITVFRQIIPASRAASTLLKSIFLVPIFILRRVRSLWDSEYHSDALSRTSISMKRSPIQRIVLIAVLTVGAASTALAQRFIDPNKGNIIYTKKGIMDGNLVRTIFLNHGEVAHWPDKPSGEWPKGTGHQYVDGVAVIVQAETRDTSNRIIHPLETNYREFIRKDPVTKIPGGWGALPGYANPAQQEPAMSYKPTTWPRTWPDRSSEWDGLWNGFFGRGIMNADLETYFRMDDAPDKQYAYWPDPSDSSRGGL